jgi:hypothetical protein
VTNAGGAYSIADVPDGDYTISATGNDCVENQSQSLTVNGDEAVDFELTLRADSFGYYCRVEPSSFVDADTVAPLTGDDAATSIALPFSFAFYGQTYTRPLSQPMAS